MDVLTALAGQLKELEVAFRRYTASVMIPPSQALVPVGGIVAIPSSMTIPTNWLACNGSTFSSTTYPVLYAHNGNSTTLPNPTAPTGCKYIIRAL